MLISHNNKIGVSLKFPINTPLANIIVRCTGRNGEACDQFALVVIHARGHAAHAQLQLFVVARNTVLAGLASSPLQQRQLRDECSPPDRYGWHRRGRVGGHQKRTSPIGLRPGSD